MAGMEKDIGETFVQLQAILASLPMHAVPPAPDRSYGSAILVTQCGGQRNRMDKNLLAACSTQACVSRIDEAMLQTIQDYPNHAHKLSQLVVEHASIDIVCFADHSSSELFVAVRGTDRFANPLTFPRDWNNNMLIALGFTPAGRAAVAFEEYRELRLRFPDYTSYGSGHSLGGAVILQLARELDPETNMAFARIDIFNTAVSPLTWSLPGLETTAVHSHRVKGDWASWGLAKLSEQSPSGHAELHTHPVKRHVNEAHSLKHFLPQKARPSLDLALADVELIPGAENTSRVALFFTALTSLACVGCRHKKQSKHLDARRTTLEDNDPFMLGNYESSAPACKDWPQPREDPVVSSNARSEDLESPGKDGASETTNNSASNGEADGHSSSSSSGSSSRSHSCSPDVASQDISASTQTAEQCLRPQVGSRPEIDPPQEDLQERGHKHFQLHEQAEEVRLEELRGEAGEDLHQQEHSKCTLSSETDAQVQS